MPFTRLTTSKLSTGPIFVSHFNDLQVGGAEDEKMHTGPPGSNVEVLIKGDGVEVVEIGGDPSGKVRV
jgi:long-chain acyl-CoA synthetase